MKTNAQKPLQGELESDMERALKYAQEIVQRNDYISESDAIEVSRALIACREPVEVTRRKQALGHADRTECGSCHWEVTSNANYCPNCGSRIKWTN